MWIPDSAGNAKAGRVPVEAGALVDALQTTKGFAMQIGAAEGGGRGKGGLGAAEHEAAGASTRLRHRHTCVAA